MYPRPRRTHRQNQYISKKYCVQIARTVSRRPWIVKDKPVFVKVLNKNPSIIHLSLIGAE